MVENHKVFEELNEGAKREGEHLVNHSVESNIYPSS
jgi:hypothetical protein